MAEKQRTWEPMVRTNARAVIERVLARINRAEGPPSLTLPESKADFPKLLCLDMKIWVQLARVFYKKSQDPSASAALSAIRDAVRAGRLAVPITTTNLDEATKHPSEDRRKRLAQFIVDLSGNFSCLSHVVTRDHEIDRAVEKHILRDEKLPSIRPYLIQWGLDAAGLGRPARLPPMDPELADLVRQSVQEPEQSVVQLVYALDAAFDQRMESREAELVKTVESARAADGHLPVAERMSQALRYFLTGQNTYTRRVMFVLIRRGVSEQAYVDLLQDGQRFLRFTEDLHQLHIWTRLWFERDRSKTDKPATNDARDGAFLGQAIGYANIVVTEKRWAHLANKTKMAERYGTTVLGRLDDFPDILKQEGCV